MKKWVSLLLAALLMAAPVFGAQAEALSLGEGIELDLELTEELEALPDEAEDLILTEDEVLPGEEFEEEAGEESFVSNEASNAAGSVAVDYTNFPDGNFRSYVAERLDTDGDGALSEAERAAVVSIDVHARDIATLEGIELFPNLTELVCYDNSLESLDVRGCPQLVSLDCGFNGMKVLNITGCSKLEELVCAENELTSLNLSGCSGLKQLECAVNSLTSLNVSKCSNLERLSCSENALTSLTVGKCSKLRELDCCENALTSLNVSKCPNLEVLTCSGNELEDLDVGKCSKLKELNCEDNRLTSLDVSGCPILSSLFCNGNDIESIDITKCDILLALVEKKKPYSDRSFCLFEDSYYEGDRKIGCEIGIEHTTTLIANGTALHGPLSSAAVTVKDQIYTGESIEPAVTVKFGSRKLKLGTDYTVTYKDNQAVGTATATVTGIGAYTGTSMATFRIGWSLSDATVSVKDQTYTGAKIEPAVTVKYGGKKLKLGTDYTVSYKSNKAIGTATVTVKGKGDYIGKNTATFRILGSLSDATVSVKDQAYTGAKLEPAVTVKLGDKKLKQGKDYSLTYKNNKKVGTATVTVKGIKKAGYTGTGKATFRINPKTPGGLKLAAGKQKLTALWSKVSGATGYQVQYGMKSDFSGAKKVTVKGTSTLRKAISKLTAKKYYYVRVRAYKTADKVNYFSAWSGKKKVKTK